jgi:hypothetical protein
MGPRVCVGAVAPTAPFSTAVSTPLAEISTMNVPNGTPPKLNVPSAPVIAVLEAPPEISVTDAPASGD